MSDMPHNFKDRLGEKFLTKQGYWIEIIEYFTALDCTIQFDDGIVIKNKSYNNITKGKIENPNYKSVFDTGYTGIGKYKSTFNGKICKNYEKWRNMLGRGYCGKVKIKNPTYKDVTVCEEWHNFQNYAKWHEENFNLETMQGWQLDKDILFKGNKIYSPTNCCFIPQEINSLFVKSNSVRGEYPIGVCFTNGVFSSNINISGKRKFLGYFSTPEEAFQAYKIAKEAHIRDLADRWKDQIEPRVYRALINYQVEITD